LEKILPIAKELAIKAVIKAGKLAKDYFDKDKEISEKEHGDLVTMVDHLAEKEILSEILCHFPNHQIRSEETGWTGEEGEWLWLVDPLDGTNNYAIGLPVYGVSITLIYNKQPVLGVIYDSHLEDLYIAEKGKGTSRNGVPISVEVSTAAFKRKVFRGMTVGWIQGHHVQKEAGAMDLKQKMDLAFKRVLRLWAPSLLWCMLARGDLDGIVLYNSEGDDLYAGILMAKEAGVAVVDFSGNNFEGLNPEPYIIACNPKYIDDFLSLVNT
jgi:myo-inositol-1(or 4)-monophosphatase